MPEEDIVFTVEDVDRAVNDIAFLAQKLQLPIDHPRLPEAQASLRQILVTNSHTKTKRHNDILLDAQQTLSLFSYLNIYLKITQRTLIEILQKWLKISNYREERRFLETHPELLRPTSISLLEKLVEQTTDNFTE